MKKIFTLALTLFLPLVAMAQTLKTPTLDDLMWGGSNYWNLVPRNTATAWWGDALVRTDVEGVSLLRNAKGAAVKAQAPLFTLDEVNAAIDTVQYGRVRSLYSVTFPEAAQPLAQITTPKAMFLYDWQAKHVVWTLPLPKDIGHEDFNTTSRSLAYTEAYNLYVLTADGHRHAVSTDGNRELLYGTSVHRDEFGIHKGTFWSPDGKRLAFYRMDQTMVTDYPLVDIQVPEAERVARPAPDKYPMAGMTSHKVTVGIFDPATDRTVWLDAGDPTDRYFTNIAWRPDGQRIYMFEVPRSQDRADLVEYDAQTGARLRTLYTERNDRYVEPQHPITFLPWDVSKFIMQSRRDGFNHLYLFNADGKELRQLTKGAFEVLEVLGFNAKAHSIILKSNAA